MFDYNGNKGPSINLIFKIEKKIYNILMKEFFSSDSLIPESVCFNSRLKQQETPIQFLGW